MKKNPLKQSDYIRDKFSSYVQSTFVLKNEKYNQDFIQELQRSVLTKGPYLKLDLPFERSYTINQLINRGEISEKFRHLDGLKLDRPLYWHQNEAWSLIRDGHNVVVTTGTGSGKTEAFLYPLLDNLFGKIREGRPLNGIQAILLYPMNALVNDQLDRFRALLKDIPEITFGYFTGDTPDKYRKNKRPCSRQEYIDQLPKTGKQLPPPNEFLTKEETRRNPPNILITNFSMLEYLLVRPKDSQILTEATLSDWSFMILDEAHIYRGALATEVAHLLKRLQSFADKSPQFILTSATLGSREEEKTDIVYFSQKLTSVPFTIQDILYARRILPSVYSVDFTIEPDDYLLIANNLQQRQSLTSIYEKYHVKDSFELLCHDANVHRLHYALGKTDTFENVFLTMSTSISHFDREHLIALISLVTDVRKDGLGIYDVKYHFFTRTLEGAFISLAPDAKLRITNRQTIDNQWAFEVGACKTCNTLYIVGKEFENRLYRSELDLDENYQFFDELHVDFYLIKDEEINEVGENLDDFEECTVCSKCGFIFQNNQHQHETCSCGKEFHVGLLKVKQKEGEPKNNLTECPVCGKTSSKTGILSSFKLGKDQSTALLSQILLQSMDLDEPKEIVAEPVSYDPFENPMPQVATAPYFKQFLAFSDSRQQASFFALFFQENQNKFLRKALVLKNLVQGKIEPLITHIESAINEKNLFPSDGPNGLSPSQHAYVCVLLELFKNDGINSLEGLGLLSFEPDFSELISSISERSLAKYLPKVKKQQLKDLLCLFTDPFRTTPAIAIERAGLTAEQSKEYLEYRRFDKSMVLHIPPKNGSYEVKSFLPVNENQDNLLTLYLSKTFCLSREDSKLYIDILWKLLCSNKILKTPDGVKYKIDLSQYRILKKEDTKWYVCDKCHTLTTHNINNCCIKGDCCGSLVECDPDVYYKDNYYRNEYISKRIERFVVEEHTAQLIREQASDYQRKFKNKEINVLSCSTTFEMGIDLGSLDTVLMRNFPPTNANYAQRAGRAGRSSSSVAFVITYANHNSHDQTYFSDPIPMIEGKINPPYIKLDNHKIVSRHIMAYVLSLFFRNGYLQHETSYFLDFGYQQFMNYVESNKTCLEDKILGILSPENWSYFNHFQWLVNITTPGSLINLFYTNLSQHRANLKEACEKAKSENKFSEADTYKKLGKQLEEADIVETMAEYNVLPGYGFPIDVVPLKVFDRQKREFNRKLAMTRDLAVAISEYAPDSEVIVDKKKYTSRYLVLSDDKLLPKYFYYRCVDPKCGKVHLSNVSKTDMKCTACGADTAEHSFIVPILGFITDENNKESSVLRPRKTYSSEITYLGSMKPEASDLNLNNFLYIQQSSDDRLLVVNENPFFYCPRCGFAVLDKKSFLLDDIRKTHQTHTGAKCSNDALIKTRLGHIIITDVVKMRIELPMDFDSAYSTLTALLNGIRTHLQVDANDINGILDKDADDKYSFIFYDTTYGGAGNVKQLLQREGLLHILGESLLSVSHECCNEEVSCTSCLRNYKNTRFHKNLKRKLARDTLKKIIEKITSI